MDSLLKWRYTKQFTIVGQSNAGTNYQVLIFVYYGSGTNYLNDVYLNGKCRSDFGDIRFTDANGNLLNYWLQGYVASESAVFWVKITDDLSSGNTMNAIMWYGNPEATTTSNGVNTFIFFDDFTNQRCNWTWSNLVRESFGGKYVLAQIADNSDAIVTLPSTISNFGMEFRYYIVSIGNYGPRAGIRFIEKDSIRFYELTNEIGRSYYNYWTSYYDGSRYYMVTWSVYNNSYSIGVWYWNFFHMLNSGINCTLGDSPQMGGYDPSIQSFDRIGFRTWDTGNKFYIDWMAIRKYVYPPPYIANWVTYFPLRLRRQYGIYPRNIRVTK